MIRVLFLGEIVGRPGIATLKRSIAELRKNLSIDYIVANAEGTTNGFGIGTAHAIQLSKLGIDLLTGGEKIFFKPDMVDFVGKSSFILRPMNFPPAAPGKFIKNISIKGKNLAIINLIGSSGFARLDINNPFVAIESFLKKVNDSIVLIQFHAAMSAEKATMLHFLDGKVVGIVGTHTKALTADGRVTDNGTAFITDNGRVGSLSSVGGLDPEVEIRKFKTQIQERSKECWKDCTLQGFIVDIDESSGKAINTMTINENIAIEAPKEN